MSDILKEIKARQERNRASDRAIARVTGQSVWELIADCQELDPGQQEGGAVVYKE